MDSNNLYVDLGKKIRARRKVKHMTLNEMASALNKSVATISKYESGDIAIGVDVLIDICRVLNIDITTLLPEQRMTIMMRITRDTKNLSVVLYTYTGTIKKRNVYALAY